MPSARPSNPFSIRLFLIRHGESAGNSAGIIQGHADYPLTDHGRGQARRVAAAMAGHTLASIYASPLCRARDTAHALALATGAPLQTLDDLREIYAGHAQGLRWDQVVERWPEFTRQFTEGNSGIDIPWPGGESSHDLYQRVRRVLTWIVDRHVSDGVNGTQPSGQAESVAIVAHGGTLAWALHLLMKKPLTTMPRYSLRNCAISEVIVRTLDEPVEIVRLNDTAHLQD